MTRCRTTLHAAEGGGRQRQQRQRPGAFTLGLACIWPSAIRARARPPHVMELLVCRPASSRLAACARLYGPARSMRRSPSRRIRLAADATSARAWVDFRPDKWGLGGACVGCEVTRAVRFFGVEWRLVGGRRGMVIVLMRVIKMG